MAHGVHTASWRRIVYDCPPLFTSVALWRIDVAQEVVTEHKPDAQSG